MMSTKSPNVILILTDDQGYGDLACHGNPLADTPNLDKLHAESIRLTDFHAAPMCTPTRGQLFTGLDAARNGALNVSSGRTLLRSELPTMADIFHADGYRTGLFGKWHLGDNYPYRPQDRGFEETLWFPSSHISSLPDYWENDYFDDVYCHNGQRKRFEGYCTETFFGKAMNWMETCIRNEESFFACLPTNAPHYPLYVPAPDRQAIEAIFKEKADLLPDEKHVPQLIRFLAMICNLDRQIGLLRDFLDKQGVAEDTILIFMTDNGSTFGSCYYNAGMRGAKCSLWEGGHRVPCFIHWAAGLLGEPRDIEGLTQVQDILPTLAELCGLPLPDRKYDGIDLTPVLRGRECVPEDRFVAINYSRMPRFDYPTPHALSVVRKEGAAVLWKRWRLLENVALYNLDTDPLQEQNVIEEYPQIAAEMRDMLDRWWAEVEPLANEIQYVIVGSDHENPSLLTACEWQDVFVDQQKQVRNGRHCNGYWHIDVAKEGTYQFDLRRWPEESKLDLRAACPETELFDGHLDKGVALPIARARILVDRRHYECQIEQGAESATFELALPAGRTLLHTWFDDDRGEPVCGAYYVQVTRLDS